MNPLNPAENYEVRRFLWNAARYCFQRAGEEQDNMLRRDYQTAMRLLRGKLDEINEYRRRIG